MARNSDINIVDEIKSRCNIVDVVGRVVPLKRAGSNFKGVCPFHNEKTPSFVVSEGKQYFNCFGCNTKGDLITFVEKYYGLEFKGAVEMLCKEYGIKMPENFGVSTSKHKDELYEINRQAAIFFYKAMREKPNPGMPYMKKRGLSDETLRDFGIGYADDSWSSLTDYLISKGFDKDKLVEVGITSISKKGTYYDKFRGRVMFPIKNTADKVIGFGGRIIGDGEPKYLNSQESQVFLKKNNLYGLNLTRKFVSEADQIILVEGYMDVISLYQAGVRNVSASLGTALTENQAALIKRYTKNVVLSYDADSAGQQAAMRGVDILYKADCRVSVLKVTDGKDPDEFIKKNGRGAFAELVKNSLPFGDFKLNFIARGFDLNDMQQRIMYLEEAVKILHEMKPIEADFYIKKLAAQTGISKEAIKREYNMAGDLGNKAQASQMIKDQSKKSQTEENMPTAEQDLIKLMLLDHKFTSLPSDIKKNVFNSTAASSIYRAILEIDKGDRPLDMNRIKDRLDQEAVDMLAKIDDKIVPVGKELEIYKDCIDHIRNTLMEAELEEIVLRLSLSDESTDPNDVADLMKRQIEIQKLLKR
ncbi:MAG: DNA primase [Firmicutes bacterium]|nr:DNA primase [Bacillota bacterium]